MKVLYIITKSNFGGAQKHVFDLATNLPKDQFEVVVALGGDGLLKQKLETAAVRTVSVGKMGRDISIFKDLSSLFDVYKIIKKERPDVIHLHSPKAAGLGALSGRLLGVKNIVYTVHGWAFNEDRGSLFKFLTYSASWLTALLVHKIITITERETEQTKLFPLVSKKVFYVHNGIEVPAFLPKNEARHFIEQKIGADLSSSIIVGTIAELHKNKGLTYAIDAMEIVYRTFPNIVFIVMGDGEEKERLNKLIIQKGLHNVVCLMGFVDNARIYLKAFDMFALTSVKEGLPYVVLEAGAAALPCVTTSVGGIPDVITDMKSGILVKLRNPDEIAQGIAYMIEHPQKAQEFASTLQKIVLTEFSIETMIKRVITLY